VILRDVDSATRVLRLHTDRTSRKAAEIVHNPRAAFCGWDAEAKLQLRLNATVSLHTDDAEADAFWASQTASSLDVYRQGRSSGDRVARPEEATRTSVPQRDRFALLIARITTIEWLWLGVEGHRRGRWSFYADGAAEHAWLVP
jgi:pyridoxine/pyridoxamine 5'-phosphate oxidase